MFKELETRCSGMRNRVDGPDAEGCATLAIEN